MRHPLRVFIPLGIALIGLAFILKGSSGQLIWDLSQEGRLFLPLVTAAALIDSINPCAFGILLVTIALLFSLGQTRSRILKLGAVYILGLFTVYILIGLGILQALHLFNMPHFMAKLGAGLLIVFGLVNVINEIVPSFPLKFRIPHWVHSTMAQLMNSASLPAVFILGILVGLCEFPCTGGPYLMILGLLHDQSSYTQGLGYLIYYNLIFILPLIAILLIASDSGLVAKVQSWKKAETRNMHLLGGLAMIGLGILIYLL